MSTTTNGAKTAPVKRLPASQEQRIKILEEQVAQLRWCFAELLYKAQLARALQQLKQAQDEVQAKLAAMEGN